MGGGQSKSKSEVFTDAVTKAVARNIMKCKYDTVMRQGIDVEGNYNIVDGVKMVQAFKIDATCFQDTKAILDLQNKIAEEIKQQAKTQSVAVLDILGKSSSEVDSTIKNSVKNSITMENVTKIITKTNMDQGINVKGDHNIVRNVDMSQLGRLIQRNSQTVVENISVINDITDQLDQEAQTTIKNPLDAIANAISAAFSGLLQPLIIVAVIIAAVALIYRMFSSGGGQQYPQYGYQYGQQQYYPGMYSQQQQPQMPAPRASSAQLTGMASAKPM